ncbi:speract receptor-like [Amphiura filiformis]|uniref:speract receptor-like n=1 Tax=Amphiura filiformis TaxID=82378 RepID=UPI003B20EC8B
MTLVNNTMAGTGGIRFPQVVSLYIGLLVFFCGFVTSQNVAEDIDIEDEMGSGESKKETLLVGFLGTYESGFNRLVRTTGGAITIAKHEINNRTDLLSDFYFDYMFVDTNATELGSIKSLTQLWRNDVVAFFGLDISCETEAHVAAAWNLPMISYHCGNVEVSNKQQYPTFARTYPTDTQITASVLALLKYYNWSKISLITANSQDTPKWQELREYFQEIFPLENITITHDIDFPSPYFYMPGGFTDLNDDPYALQKIVDKTYITTRIYIFFGFDFELSAFCQAFESRGLLDNGEYMIIFINDVEFNQDNAYAIIGDPFSKEFSPEHLRCYRSVLFIYNTPVTNEAYDQFLADVKYFLTKAPFFLPDIPDIIKNDLDKFYNESNPDDKSESDEHDFIIPLEAAYLYDSLLLYAKALNKSLAQNIGLTDGTSIMKNLFDSKFQSITGYDRYIDKNGDTLPNNTVVAVQFNESTTSYKYDVKPVAKFHIIEDTDGNGSSVSRIVYVPIEGLDIQWIGPGPPVDEPHCGYYGENCIPKEDSIPEIVGGVIGGIIFVILIAMALFYRNWKYEQELSSLLWKVDYDDIKRKGQNGSARSVGSRVSMFTEGSRGSGDQPRGQIFTEVGNLKGTMVAIKKLRKRTIDLNRMIRKELKVIRDLRHPHLNLFIGACVEPPNICVLTEYCPKGSLQDILENDEVKLDDMFIASIIGDIVKGMTYLHSSEIHTHGNLKSSNCVVDSRWVLKITDFGLCHFKAGQELPEHGDNAYYQSLLWRAPELLRDPNPPPEGTQKGDVYAFGIILYEIVLRTGPYGNCPLEAEEIIERVKTPKDITVPFRPNVNDLEECPDCVFNVMQECWGEIPDQRPDFKALRTKLKPLQKGLKSNILDNMISIMEKYATNLEEIVEDRTQQLIEEKKKTENLLHQMLPKPIANQLKRGRQVVPETFDSVTIFFSDIVGFTALSGQSTPLQVVDMLNDLYTCFDAIISYYDVYKVETIGDAYMLVSGIPIRNGNRHAAEIASTSIHLLDAVNHFQIRHRPEEKLKLRVGLHSGPAVAGVVGLTMPRYCLFGDTVNTASRMESNGAPLKIHCSEEIKVILDIIGGYVVEERGLVAMKGKGELKTYWLLDQDPDYRRETPLDVESDDEGSQLLGSSGPNQRTSTNYLFAQQQQQHRDSFSSIGKKDDSKPPSTGGCPCCNDMQAAKRRSNQSLDRKEVHSTHSDGGYKSQNCITDCSSREGAQTPGDRNSIGLDTRLSPESTGNNGKVLMTDHLLLDLDLPKKPGDNDVSRNLSIDTKPDGEETVV